MVRNIIWDVDGTLFDTYPAISMAFRAAVCDFGREATIEWIEELAKISLGHCASTLASQFQINEDALGETFTAHYDRVKPEDQSPFPGVIRICEYICSIGGKNVIVTHRGQAGTNALLEAHNMARLFAGCITRNDGYAKKPAPAAFNAIVQIHDLKREETITVGDREIDIVAGQGAGIFSCFFGCGESAADLTIQTFAGLYAYIRTQNRDT